MALMTLATRCRKVKTMENETKPKLRLTGTDGNAFAIMGACIKLARKQGWSQDKIATMQKEFTSGDYNNLLQVACRYFDVR